MLGQGAGGQAARRWRRTRASTGPPVVIGPWGMRTLVITGAGSARVEDVEVPVRAGQVDLRCPPGRDRGTDVELFTGQLAYFAQGKIGSPIRPVAMLRRRLRARRWGRPGVAGRPGDGRYHARLRALRARARPGAGTSVPPREVGIVELAGRLAEEVLVRASSLYRLPDAIDDRSGALVEPGGNGWRAASAAQGRSGEADPGLRAGHHGPADHGVRHGDGGRGRDLRGSARDREELAAGFGATGYWTADDPAPRSTTRSSTAPTTHRMPAAALARVGAGRTAWCTSASRACRARSTVATSSSAI